MGQTEPFGLVGPKPFFYSYFFLFLIIFPLVLGL
jgi:hypothetical protein